MVCFRSHTLRDVSLILPLILAGCLVLPIPTPENKVLEGKPVAEEELGFLDVACVTKQEVIQRLGSPNVIWVEPNLFVYHWEMRQGLLFWAVGAYYTGAMGLEDIPKHYLLLIQFDRDDTVTRYGREVRPLTQSYPAFLREWVLKAPGGATPSP